MNYKCTKERFLEDVKDHQIEVCLDQGLYRHIRLHKPKSWNYGFGIVTSPGFLFYYGDMGAYTFSRTPDMFAFFRGKELKINPGYWSEKVKAASVFGNGIREFTVEDFNNSVLDCARAELGIEEEKIPDDIMKELESVLNPEDMHDAISAVREFGRDKLCLQDFGEFYYEDYTFHYIWCCYAIVWAIQKYDEVKSGDTKDEM